MDWVGVDIEDDIVSFMVYFSEQNPPSLLQTVDAAIMELDVDVISGSSYYWSIIATDVNGNTSASGIYDFIVF